ncbi:MAG TPA: ATP-binding protein [Ignavibacteria bacterium]|nr:ATP-binding protein [Ignavibacteria bacterium]
MVEKRLLKNIILENLEIVKQKQVIRRNFGYDSNANYVIVGSRRTGKTYFLFQIIQQLFREDNNRKDILYINFEDERLIEFNLSDFDLLLESFKEIFNVKPILFLDEIQNISGWEKFVRRMADTGYRVFVTGSNAKLLSSEIASTVGGRFLIIQIYPLSFSEFLLFKDFDLEENYEYSSQRFEIKKLFNEYLQFGGFPEIVKYEFKKEYLSNIFQKVVYGDILARNRIKNDYLLKLMVKKLAENTTSETSFTRLKNIIKSSGINCGTNTLIEYFRYLSDSFLIFGLENYASKFVERESKKKYYFNDTGLLNLFFFDEDPKLLETLVFNHLKRTCREDFFYLRGKREINFLFLEEKLIQVSYSIKDFSTREREVGAIKKFIGRKSYSEILIITFDEEEEIKIDDQIITVIPAWKWLLK